MIRKLAGAIAAEAARAAGKAAEKVLADPRGQEALARAVGLAQRGKQVADEIQERALHAAGIAARKDHDEIRKQIARIRRKARALGEKLEGARAGDAARPAADAGTRSADTGTTPREPPGGGDSSR